MHNINLIMNNNIVFSYIIGFLDKFDIKDSIVLFAVTPFCSGLLFCAGAPSPTGSYRRAHLFVTAQVFCVHNIIFI